MLQDKLGLVCHQHIEITGYTIGTQTHTDPRSTNNFAHLTGRNFGLSGACTSFDWATFSGVHSSFYEATFSRG